MRTSSRHAMIWVCITMAAGLGLACSKEAGRDPQQSSPGPQVLEFRTSEHTYVSHSPAVLKVYAGNAPNAEFAAGGSSDGWRWSFFGSPQLQQLPGGNVSIVLQQGATSPGTGNVNLFNANGGTEASAGAGTGQLTMSKGRIHGVVQTDSSKLDGILDGALAVSCWVPSSELPSSEAGGLGPPDDPSMGQVLVEDRDFVTVECVPFKALR